MNFRFAPGARLDLFDLVDWYAAQTVGAGADLATAFDDTLQTVLTHPRMYGRVPRAAGMSAGSGSATTSWS